MTTPYDTIKIAGGDTATPRNLEKRLAAIAPWLHSGAAFLDCGCGCGEYVRALRERHAVNAQGVEYLADKVAQAKADPRVADHVRQGDIERLPFPDGSFDTALLNEVLEHVPDENAALTEIRRVLKPSGVLIIFSPNRWYPFETHGTFLKYKFAPPPY
ncbi:MAG: class I SAM-dependent methyltransferase [Verrucomicrobiales bacterium]|jgi:ubiquinone/menaquinone biosynthesis C-methylase UbiE|nr:class I SAM-dependent methyltransferase [Verrucomicrobiales bacterium]